MGIEFVKIVKRNSLLNPFKNFDEDQQTIEYRKDPLLERWCRINIERAQRVKELERENLNENFTKYIQKTERICYFCEQNLDKQTPRFPPSLFQDGRISCGEAFVFPNLFPFGEHHAICTISRAHLYDIKDIDASMLEDGLKASNLFFKRVHEVDDEAVYPMVNFNFLPPSGASIVHPHLQILINWKGTRVLNEVIGRSRNYHDKEGRCYWNDLIKAEKTAGERYIREGGTFTWLASWAPVGNNEVIGISRDPVSCLMDMSDKQLRDLAAGLCGILKGLREKRGIQSLNFSVYSSPVGVDIGKFFHVFVRVLSRPNLRGYYASDRGFMEVLHDEAVIQCLPEEMAKDLRRF